MLWKLLALGALGGGGVALSHPDLKFRINEKIRQLTGKNLLADISIQDLIEGKRIMSPLSDDEARYLRDNFNKLPKDKQIDVLMDLSSVMIDNYKNNNLTKTAQAMRNLKIITGSSDIPLGILQNAVELKPESSLKIEKLADELELSNSRDRLIDTLYTVGLATLPLGIGGGILGSVLRSWGWQVFGRVFGLTSAVSFTGGVLLESEKSIRTTGREREAITNILGEALTLIPIAGISKGSRLNDTISHYISTYNKGEEIATQLTEALTYKEVFKNKNIEDYVGVIKNLNIKGFTTTMLEAIPDQDLKFLPFLVERATIEELQKREVLEYMADRISKIAKQVGNNEEAIITAIKQDPELDSLLKAYIKETMASSIIKNADRNTTIRLEIIKDLDDIEKTQDTIKTFSVGYPDDLVRLFNTIDEHYKDADRFILTFINEKGEEIASSVFRPYYLPTWDNILRAKVIHPKTGVIYYYDIPLHYVDEFEDVLKQHMKKDFTEEEIIEVFKNKEKLIDTYIPANNLFVHKIQQALGRQGYNLKVLDTLDEDIAGLSSFEDKLKTTLKTNKIDAKNFLSDFLKVEGGKLKQVFNKVLELAKKDAKILDYFRPEKISERNIDTLIKKLDNALKTGNTKEIIKYLKQLKSKQNLEELKNVNKILKENAKKELKLFRNLIFLSKHYDEDFLKFLTGKYNNLDELVKISDEMVKQIRKIKSSLLTNSDLKKILKAPPINGRLKTLIDHLITNDIDTLKTQLKVEIPQSKLENLKKLLIEGFKTKPYEFARKGKGFYTDFTKKEVLKQLYYRPSVSSRILNDALPKMKMALEGMRGNEEYKHHVEIFENFLKSLNYENALTKLNRVVGKIFTAINYPLAISNFLQTLQLLAQFNPKILSYIGNQKYFIQEFRRLTTESAYTSGIYSFYRYNYLNNILQSMLLAGLRAFKEAEPEEYAKLIKNIFGKEFNLNHYDLLHALNFNSNLFMPVWMFKNFADKSLYEIGASSFFWFKQVVQPFFLSTYTIKSIPRLMKNLGIMTGTLALTLTNLTSFLTIGTHATPLLAPVEQLASAYLTLMELVGGIDPKDLPPEIQRYGITKTLLLYGLGDSRITFRHHGEMVLANYYFATPKEQENFLTTLIRGADVLRQYGQVSMGVSFMIEGMPLTMVKVIKQFTDKNPNESLLQHIIQNVQNLPAFRNTINELSDKIVFGKVIRENDRAKLEEIGFLHMLGTMAIAVSNGGVSRIVDMIVDLANNESIRTREPVITYGLDDKRTITKALDNQVAFINSMKTLYHYDKALYYKTIHDIILRIERLRGKPDKLGDERKFQEKLDTLYNLMNNLYEVNKELKDDLTDKAILLIYKYLEAHNYKPMETVK